MFADPDAQVLMECTKQHQRGFALRRTGSGVGVRTSQARHEVHPPKEPEHLHETGEDPDCRRYGQDASETERLRQHHHGTDHQEAGEHERPPQDDQQGTSRQEPLQDLLRRSSQDVRVVEPHPEQRERGVEP